MSKKTVLTCAVTGNLTKPEANENLPVTPQQIAVSSLEAAEAGAAIVHIHVRYPDGRPSMALEHYREVVDRIRAKNSAVIINLTTGPGGRYHPSDDDPRVPGERTTLLPPLKRVEHIAAIRPDVCTLDLNTMNSGGEVVMNTPSNVRKMAEVINDCGVTPEIELFDSGDINLACDLVVEGTLRQPMLASLVLGVKYGFAATSNTMMYARSLLPEQTVWSGFGVGKMAFPMLVQSWLLGGNIRIGLEDTVYIAKGRKASGNGELCDKSRWLIENLGGSLATPEEARELLGLVR